MNNFSVGDQVTWMHSSSNGCRLRFSSRQGKIVELYKNGIGATVKLRNGRTQDVLLKMLRKAGEKTELTKLFEEIAKGAKL
jgi:hypothetical protein